jgi:hypothetical protein
MFHGDLLNQNLLQRAYRFQVLLQAGQQTGELSLVLAVNYGSVLESKPYFVVFQELITLPADVFDPVDFFALLRLASIFRGEDPFEGIVSVCVDSALFASEVFDST